MRPYKENKGLEKDRNLGIFMNRSLGVMTDEQR